MAEEMKSLSIVESQLREFIEELRPEDEEVLKRLDFGYSWDGKTATIYEIRPRWNSPGEILHLEFAKFEYVKSRRLWKLYWRRASGNWNIYEPRPEYSTIHEIFDEIMDDSYHVFFG